MTEFKVDYIIFVFVATLGVVQIAAVTGSLRGLLLFGSLLRSGMSGAAMLVTAVVWFFATDDRNINDVSGGINANGQALYLFSSATSSVVFTLLLSSLFNLRMRASAPPPHDGLEVLRTSSFLNALFDNMRYLRCNWRTQTKRFLSG